MALPASDTFTASENPLTTNWTTIVGWGDMQKDGADAKPATASIDSGAFWDADTFDADQYSIIEIAAIGSNLGDIGAVVRCNITDDDFHIFAANDPNVERIYIAKVIN